MKQKGFKSYGEGKKLLNRVMFEESEKENIAELAKLMKGWRNRTIYINGEKVPWNSVFDFLNCYDRRSASYRPDYYCFDYEEDWALNIWGCLHSQMTFNEHSDWFSWGVFDKKGSFHFDKDRIRHTLEKNLFPYRLCPSMDTERLSHILEIFPDSINPKKDKNWKYILDWNGDMEGGMKVITTQYGENVEVTARGVAPKDRKAAVSILKAANLMLPTR
jgi:hypothetical protein